MALEEHQEGENATQPGVAAGLIVPLAGLALVYFAAASVALAIASESGPVPPVWIANAIAIAFILRARRIPVALSLGAVAAANAAAFTLDGSAAAHILAFTLSHLVEIAFAVAIVGLLRPGAVELNSSIADYLKTLGGAAVAGPLAGAAVFVVLASGFGLEVAGPWNWVTSSLAGAIIVLPIALMMSRESIRAALMGRAAIGVIGIGVAFAALAFASTEFLRAPIVPVALPVTVAALLFQPLATAIVAVVTIVSVTVVHALESEAGYASVATAVFLAAISTIAPFCVAFVVQRLRNQQKQLAESERLFGAAMEHTVVATCLVDTKRNRQYPNQAMLDFLGCTEKDLEDRAVLDWTHPDDMAESLRQRELLLSGKIAALRLEKRYIRTDGTIAWADVSAALIRDEATGEPSHHILHIVDITSRRKAEEALATSERRLNFAIDSGGQGVWDYDLVAGRTYYSPGWAAMFGITREEIGEAPDAWFDLVHPEDLDAVKTDDDALFNDTAGVFSHVFRMRHKAGHWVWVDNRGRVVERDADGKPLRAIGIYTDISDLKKVEAKLEESEERWAFALESGRQGVWDINLGEGTAYYSPYWKGMLGYLPHEIEDKGNTWKSLIHPDDLPGVEEADQALLEGRSKYFEMEFRMRHKQGHWVWVLDRGQVIHRDENGSPLRVIGTHTDVTQRRRSEEKLRSLSQRVQLASKSGGVGLWEFDIRDGSLWWDERMRSLYGLGPDDPTSRDVWASLLHPEDLERAQQEVDDAIDKKQPYDTAFRIVLSDGRVRHIRSMADTLRDEHGVVYKMSGTNWDVTETHELTEALGREKDRLRVTLSSIGDGVICTDTSQRITFINRVAAMETGWADSEALGRPIEDVFKLVQEETGEAVANPVGECLETWKPATIEHHVVLVNQMGRRQDVRAMAAPIISDNGELLGAVLAFQDVTRSRQLQRQLAFSASHDTLTGLANRSSIERQLRDVCEEAASRGGRHSLCFIDLDRFKQVNDTAGHAVGDQVLRLVARAIHRSVRSEDHLARLGGDEFALILKDCEPEEALPVCEQIIQSICELELVHAKHTFSVGASIGIAVIDGSTPPGKVLIAADAACYEAKASGRNQVRVHEPSAGGAKLADAS